MVMAWRVGRSGFGRMRRSGRSASRRLAPGVSVAQVARRYAVNANLIFKWLRDPRYAPDPAAAPGLSEGSRFLPVEIVAEAKALGGGACRRQPHRDRTGGRAPDADQRRL